MSGHLRVPADHSHLSQRTTSVDAEASQGELDQAEHESEEGDEGDQAAIGHRTRLLHLRYRVVCGVSPGRHLCRLALSLASILHGNRQRPRHLQLGRKLSAHVLRREAIPTAAVGRRSLSTDPATRPDRPESVRQRDASVRQTVAVR